MQCARLPANRRSDIRGWFGRGHALMVGICCPESRLGMRGLVPMPVPRVSSVEQDSMDQIRLCGSHVGAAVAFRPFGLMVFPMVINTGQQAGERNTDAWIGQWLHILARPGDRSVWQGHVLGLRTTTCLFSSGTECWLPQRCRMGNRCQSQSSLPGRNSWPRGRVFHVKH